MSGENPVTFRGVFNFQEWQLDDTGYPNTIHSQMFDSIKVFCDLCAASPELIDGYAIEAPLEEWITAQLRVISQCFAGELSKAFHNTFDVNEIPKEFCEFRLTADGIDFVMGACTPDRESNRKGRQPPTFSVSYADLLNQSISVVPQSEKRKISDCLRALADNLEAMEYVSVAGGPA